MPVGARFEVVGVALQPAALLNSVLPVLLLLLLLMPDAVALGAAGGGFQLYGLLLLLVTLPAADAMAAAEGDLGVPGLLRGLRTKSTSKQAGRRVPSTTCNTA